MSKIIDEALKFLFDKVWGRLLMIIFSPSLSAWFASRSNIFADPLIIWFSALLGLLIAVLLIANVQRIRKGKKIRLEENLRKKFINQTIRLDGNKFINCQFDACTIEYAGGDFIIDNSDIGEDCRLHFMTKESITTAQLLYNYKFLQKPIFMLDQYGRVLKKPEIIEKKVKI